MLSTSRPHAIVYHVLTHLFAGVHAPRFRDGCVHVTHRTDAIQLETSTLQVPSGKSISGQNTIWDEGQATRIDSKLP